MCTGLIDTGNKFTELLELSKYKENSMLSIAWNTANEIWEEKALDYYTNHDLQHSVMIADYFMQLNPVFKWSEYERLVFGVAAIIHDIGMQYNIWLPKYDVSKIFPDGELSDDEVRERHCELGFMLLEQQWRYENPLFQHLGMFYEYSKLNQKRTLFFSSYIAFAHCSDEYFNFIKESDTFNEGETNDRQNFRPRLLAGIFRICDILDITEGRVINHANRILSKRINDNSTLHWLACLFIKRVEISIKKQVVVHIDIDWNLPFEWENEKKLVENFLIDSRMIPIKVELETVKEYFRGSGDDHYNSIQIKFNGLNDNPEKLPFWFAHNDELLKLIKNYGSQLDVPIEKANKKGNKTDDISSSLEMEKIKFPSTLHATLYTWYKEHRELGHHELLNSGEHTNIYIPCRKLLSDVKLMREVVDFFYNYYFEKNIQSIISIGTSPIPLTVYLALRMNCYPSYTFFIGNNEDQKDNELLDNVKNYSQRELTTHLSGIRNILIIDDVTSNGDAAFGIIEQLSKSNKDLRNAYHCSIFKLGSRDFNFHNHIKEFKYIVSIPEIKYFKKKDCPWCQAGYKLTREAERIDRLKIEINNDVLS